MDGKYSVILAITLISVLSLAEGLKPLSECADSLRAVTENTARSTKSYLNFLSKIKVNDSQRKLIMDNLRLIGFVGQPYLRAGLDENEIRAAGFRGLFEAARVFDPSKGMFSTHAITYIKRQMEDYRLADDPLSLYGTPEDETEGKRIVQIEKKWNQSHTRPATSKELAEIYNTLFNKKVKLTEEKVDIIRGKEKARAYTLVSTANQKSGVDTDLASDAPTLEDIVDQQQSPQRMSRLFEEASLTPREIRYLIFYFGLPLAYLRGSEIITNENDEDLTYQQIADLENRYLPKPEEKVNAKMIRNRIMAALKKLKPFMTEEDRSRALHQ